MAFNFPCFDHIIRVALSTPGISLLKRLDTVTEREKKKDRQRQKDKERDRERQRERERGGGYKKRDRERDRDIGESRRTIEKVREIKSEEGKN